MPKGALKLRVVNESDRRPVAFASLSVEYPDTIICYEVDRKGRLSFMPASFPLTVTARASGMLDSTIGLMSMPDEKVVIGIAPDPDAVPEAPRRRPDWSTAMQRRLRSTYTVRSSSGK